MTSSTKWDDLIYYKKMKSERGVELAHQTAQILAKCSLGVECVSVVDNYVLPRLQELAGLVDNELMQARIQTLCKVASRLKSLPLSLCHIDINAGNIIVSDDLKVVGLIDWEAATLLPLGMNTWCIRFLSVPIRGGNDLLSENAVVMAKAFWRGFTDGMSEELQRVVVIAMQIGFVLIHAYPEGYPPTADRLPKLIERLDWLKDTFEPLCA